MCVCVETRSLLKHGKVKSKCWAPRSEVLFFSFPFLAFKRKEQKMIFPPCVRLLTHFFSSIVSQRQPFPLLTTAPLCFYSHQTSSQQDMKDGAINNVVVVAAKRTCCTHTSILSLGLTSSAESFLLISQKLLLSLSLAHSLSFFLSYSDVIKSVFFLLGCFFFFKNLIEKV